MTPWDNIHKQALAALVAGQELWLVTLLAVEGSSFRRPGARALMTRERTVAGCVAGYCAESQLRDQFGNRDAACLTLPDTGNIGCQGTLHVLVERLTTDSHLALFEQIDRFCHDGHGTLEIETHFKTDDTRLHISRSWHVTERPTPPSQTRFEYLSGTGTRERIPPPPGLAVFAEAGEASQLVEQARALNWRVTLFTESEGPGLNADVVEAALASQSFAAAVIMTRRYGVDLRLTAQCLRSCSAYVGIVSSRQRAAMLATDLAEHFPELTESFDKLHAPAGLDLGGDSPQSVALAILAEIHACLFGADAESLRDGAGAIHRRGKSSGVSTSTGSPQASQGTSITGSEPNSNFQPASPRKA